MTPSPAASSNARQYWVDIACRLARPLLTCLAEGRFEKDFLQSSDTDKSRAEFAGIESLSRLLAGIGPWLESKIDHALRD